MRLLRASFWKPLRCQIIHSGPHLHKTSVSSATPLALLNMELICPPFRSGRWWDSLQQSPHQAVHRTQLMLNTFNQQLVTLFWHSVLVNDYKYKGQTQRHKALYISLFDLPEATREGALLCVNGNYRLHIQPDKLMRRSHSLTEDLLLGKHTQLVWEKNMDVKWDSVVVFL